MVILANNRIIGKKYEDVASDYLSCQGYEILERNYRSRSGEIDIIARDGDYIVFVEVKYRGNYSYGDPLEAVDLRKQQKIRHTAFTYLYKEKYAENTPVRFDVIGITDSLITLIKNAF